MGQPELAFQPGALDRGREAESGPHVGITENDGPALLSGPAAACGICGTDLHILEGEFAPSLPIIPGHEFAGVVVATGADVRGDHRGYDVLRSQLGAHILIYGSGTMGLMMLELAKRTGAASVDMVDLNQDRLATAVALGCSRTATSADELDQPRGWELVIDATGAGPAIQDGLPRVTPGGTFLQFGVASYDTRVTIEPYRIYNKEITITGSMAVLHSFERAAELFAVGVPTRTCSSATGSRWRTTPGRSTGSRGGSAARSRSSPSRRPLPCGHRAHRGDGDLGHVPSVPSRSEFWTDLDCRR